MNLNVNGNAFTDRVPEEVKSKGLSSVKIKKKASTPKKSLKDIPKITVKKSIKKEILSDMKPPLIKNLIKKEQEKV